MCGKSLVSSQFWIVKVTLFKIADPDSVRVRFFSFELPTIADMRFDFYFEPCILWFFRGHRSFRPTHIRSWTNSGRIRRLIVFLHFLLNNNSFFFSVNFFLQLFITRFPILDSLQISLAFVTSLGSSWIDIIILYDSTIFIIMSF